MPLTLSVDVDIATLERGWSAGDGSPPVSVAELARRAETLGFDGVASSEMAHDAFLPLVQAASETRALQLGTAVALAPARSPVAMAQTAWDLHTLSGERFWLGLGSQTKTHVRHRLGMRWPVSPVRWMAEYIDVVRIAWACWRDGTPFEYRGEFFRVALMHAAFVPRPAPLTVPRLLVGAVGPRMAEMAGARRCGVLTHLLSTPSYLRRIVLPAYGRGLRQAPPYPPPIGAAPGELCAPVIVATGISAALDAAITAARAEVAFFATTPTYRRVLDAESLGDLAMDAVAWLRRGDDTMLRSVVPDDVLTRFAVIGAPGEVGREIAQRYGGLACRVGLHAPAPTPLDSLAAVADAIRASHARTSSA